MPGAPTGLLLADPRIAVRVAEFLRPQRRRPRAPTRRIQAIVVDAHRPGDTTVFRTRLLLVETYTIVALLAQHDRQVRRDLGRDAAISSDPVDYRSWHRRILDARTPATVTHVDFDVIIGITRHAPRAETVALLDALM